VQRIAILGAGSWGTALAVHLARTGHDVRLWGRDADLVAAMIDRRENRAYLPGVALDARVTPTTSMEAALPGASLVVIAVPSHGLRAALRHAVPLLPAGAPIVSTVKGLEQGSLFRMTEVIGDEAGSAWPIVALSGPTFAREIAAALPSAVSVASADTAAAELVQAEFRSPAVRLYVTDDVVGVEMGGALKNVIAIAAGLVESLGLGHNAMAALVTRGLAEMSRLAMALGGRRETLAGLSGLGDLVLTCTGDLSRNRQVGIDLGKGVPLETILGGMRMVAEGVRTAQSALALGARHGVELPIIAQMHEVLDAGKSPRAALGDLMLRPQRPEHE
jgi:glycerol-3-phosphate dehydrogenase (NAD(P)+)